jgi:hypothetical protein
MKAKVLTEEKMIGEILRGMRQTGGEQNEVIIGWQSFRFVFQDKKFTLPKTSLIKVFLHYSEMFVASISC